MDFVVPLPMEFIPVKIELGDLLIGNFDALGVGAGIQFGVNLESGGSALSRNQADNDFKTDQRFATPVLGNAQKRRCSILFHLLVPGGKWRTAMLSGVSSANFCNSSFHSRTREPLLPPP